MFGQLFDAAGNRILWLDATDRAGETDFGQQKVIGHELAGICRLEQELTAVLFRGPRGLRALFWNVDGSFESVCGNAIRCLAHFRSRGMGFNGEVSVETPRGIYLSRRVDDRIGAAWIPAQSVRVGRPFANGDLFVDVGTPHVIRKVQEDWPEADVLHAVERSSGAEAVNFNLVRRIASLQYRVRVFERGVGETFSCGTSAVAVAAVLGAKTLPEGGRRADHQIEFASGEQLTVSLNPSGGFYELSGRVAILQEVSV